MLGQTVCIIAAETVHASPAGALQGTYMRALVVEDDVAMQKVVARCLRELAFAVDTADTGQEALDRIAKTDYDLLVLDLILPDLDGSSVLRSVRERKISVPAMVLSSRNAVADKVNLLDAGADDYLTKPFAMDEFVARIGALTRRAPALQARKIEIDDLLIDNTARRVFRGGSELLLTVKEYTILSFLARREGNVVSRSELASHAWDANFDESSNSIDVLMSRLRKKVDHGRPTKLIHTIRGSGYLIGIRNAQR